MRSHEQRLSCRWDFYTGPDPGRCTDLHVAGVPSGSALTLNVGFEDVSGMKAGDPVRIRGLRSGVVDKIVLDPQRDLAVATIQLGQNLEPREGYEFKILPASALGGTYLRYTPGVGDLVATDDLRGLAGGDVLGEVGDFLTTPEAASKTGFHPCPACFRNWIPPRYLWWLVDQRQSQNTVSQLRRKSGDPDRTTQSRRRARGISAWRDLINN